MNKDFRLPDVGEGLTEADIVSWHVKPGDTVTINQIIVEIETAKAVVELPSPYAGTVTALLVNEGQTVDVGIPIITIDVPVAGEAPADPAPAADAAPAETAAAETAAAEPPAPAAAPASPARQPVLVVADLPLGDGLGRHGVVHHDRGGRPRRAAADVDRDDRRADVCGGAFGHQQIGHGARVRARQLDHRFRRFDLDDDLVDDDLVAGVDVPPDDVGLGQAFSDIRELELLEI